MSISTATLARYVKPGYAFVETGTDGGGGIASALECGAAWACSCDIERSKVEAARVRFHGDPRVHVTCCASEAGWVEAAARGARSNGQPTTFWLDAHGPGGTPILAELEAIRSSGVVPAVVLIDDCRYFWSRYWAVEFADILRACLAIAPCRFSLVPGADTGQVGHGAPDILVAEYGA